MLGLLPHLEQNKNRYSIIFITIIVFLNLIIDQSINTILIESVQPLDVNFKGWLTIGYMALSIPGSLLMAGWSDFHCRRKTIIFALVFAFLSFIAMVIYNQLDIKGLGIASLIIKALLGNVTPICFAILADKISKKRFRNVLAIAIIAYSIGIWAPIYFRSSLMTNLNFLFLFTATTLIAIACTFLFVKDDKFDNVKLSRPPVSPKAFFSFLRNDTKLIVVFLISPIIAPAILCFFFGEVSYYQFLLRGALLSKADFFISQALVLAIGYFIGTIVLLVLGWLNIKDMTCIKIGLLISLLSSGAIIFEYYYSNISARLDILIALFSIGFSLVTPSLFAAISKISKVEEQGKIYGSLDSTDTLATFSSALIINRTKFSPIYLILLFTFLIFSLSCAFFLRFLRRYKEVNNAHKF